MSIRGWGAAWWLIPLALGLAAKGGESDPFGEVPTLPPPHAQTQPAWPVGEPDVRVVRGLNLISEERANALLIGPEFEVPCPVCQRGVRLPELYVIDPDGERRRTLDWEFLSTDVDVDLCPHPVGSGLSFNAQFAQCFNCGFSAHQSDFLQPQPPSVGEWVARTITPSFRLNLLHYIGEPQPPAGAPIPSATLERIRELFVHQKDMPDTIRMEVAWRYYEFMQTRPSTLAHIAQQAAWAYRRAQASAPEGAFMLEGVRVVRDILQPRDAISQDAISAQLRRLEALMTETRPDGTPRLSWYQRQCARFIAASLYAREGFLPWAKWQLQEAGREAARFADDPYLDPLWPDVPDDLPYEARVQQLIDRRSALANYARVRQTYLDLEAAHLANAAQLLAEALGTDEGTLHWPSIPARTYQVGEWYRRSLRLPQAFLWLDAARQMHERLREMERLPQEMEGLEIFARQQLDELRRYAAHIGQDLEQVSEEDVAAVADAFRRYWLMRREAADDYERRRPAVLDDPELKTE